MREAGIDEAEMLKTFNCGVGMILVAPKKSAGKIEKALVEAGETPFRLGELVAEPGVAYRGSLA